MSRACANKRSALRVSCRRAPGKRSGVLGEYRRVQRNAICCDLVMRSVDTRCESNKGLDQAVGQGRISDGEISELERLLAANTGSGSTERS